MTFEDDDVIEGLADAILETPDGEELVNDIEDQVLDNITFRNEFGDDL